MILHALKITLRSVCFHLTNCLIFVCAILFNPYKEMNKAKICKMYSGKDLVGRWGTLQLWQGTAKPLSVPNVWVY